VSVDTEQPEGALQPPTEEIHLPDPSYLPVVLAFGVMIALVGVIKSWVIVAIGVIIFGVALIRWIRQTREEMSQLPLEH
jgi:Flp pilus assembly protein TadB